jgi:hypothetical protein
MKKSQESLRLWFIIALVALSIATTNATSVIPPTFQEIADRAELIFIGKVVSLRSEWRNVGANRVIFTMVEFERLEVLKGKAGASVTLQFLGGTVGDATMQVDGVPKFNLGDRELLFVAGNGVQFCPIVGVFHGKFGVRKDEGRDILVKHNGKALRDVAEIGADVGSELGPKRAGLSIATNAAPLSLDDFKSKIHERLNSSAPRK